MHNREDILLLKQLKQGSVPAYERLFKKYYEFLCAEAFYLLGDKQEAEDQVQLLFVEIWDKKVFRNINQSLKAYLSRAVHNKCLNELGKKRIIRKRFHEYKQLAADHTDTEHPEEPDRRPEPDILTVLEELPPQRQLAFSLVYLKNKRYREAADEMGITVNSIKTHLKKASRMLRQRLGRYRSPD